MGGGDFLAGQGHDALGAGALEGIVQVGHRLAQSLALRRSGSQGLLVTGLVGSDIAQMTLGSLQGSVGSLKPGPVPVVASKGGLSGRFVDAAPPALTGQRNDLLGLLQLVQSLAALPLGPAQVAGALDPPQPLGAEIDDL